MNKKSGQSKAAADKVERVTGIENSYISRVLELDGKIENVHRKVRFTDDGKRNRQSIVGWTVAGKGERQGVTFSSCSGLPEKSSKRVDSSHTLLNAILSFRTDGVGRILG